MEIKLTEEVINKINKLLQTLPISHLDTVKEITEIMNSCIVVDKK
jgi:hypothetical protein